MMKPIPSAQPAFRALAAALLLAGAVSGCSMAPTYQRPAAPVADAFPAVPPAAGAAGSEASTGATQSAVETGWRNFFLMAAFSN